MNPTIYYPCSDTHIANNRFPLKNPQCHAHTATYSDTDLNNEATIAAPHRLITVCVCTYLCVCFDENAFAAGTRLSLSLNDTLLLSADSL